MSQAQRSPRILIIDDEETVRDEVAQELRESLGDLNPELVLHGDFTEATLDLSTGLFDLAILDVRQTIPGEVADPERGRKVFQEISRVQWLPVIFYTAAPERVDDLKEPPLVSVINKTDVDGLVEAVRAGLDSGVPQFVRSLADHMSVVVREFVRDHVAPYWDGFSEADRADIVPVIANRLSAHIKFGYLDQEHDPNISAAMPSAARFYLMPPVESELSTGDVIASGDEWWVVLTPACDLVIRDGKRKVEYVRLAAARPVLKTEPGKLAARGPDSRGQLKSAMGDSNRYFYLPQFRVIPDLLVDLEQVKPVALEEVLDSERYRRVATLDSPFLEALLQRYGRSVSRIGIEDFEVKRLFREWFTARAEDPS